MCVPCVNIRQEAELSRSLLLFFAVTIASFSQPLTHLSSIWNTIISLPAGNLHYHGLSSYSSAAGQLRLKFPIPRRRPLYYLCCCCSSAYFGAIRAREWFYLAALLRYWWWWSNR